MSSLILKIDQIIEERSLLGHPFYQTWSEGKLTRDALAGYAKEYFQLVKAVPKFMEPLLENAPESMYDELDYNQTEETNHINLWIKFANELGISYNELTNYAEQKKRTRLYPHSIRLCHHLKVAHLQCMHLKKKYQKSAKSN